MPAIDLAGGILLSNGNFELYLIILVLLLVSAFFSACETALSSANRIRIGHYLENGHPGAEKANYIISHFDKALSTILIGNNIVNIAAATMAADVASRMWGGSQALFISSAVMTVLVLIFGEILPKSYAKENAEIISLRIAGILVALMYILSPVTWVLVSLNRFSSRIIGRHDTGPSVTEAELKVMVTMSEEEGVIGEGERDLVHSALDFNDISVGEVLTPRIDMIAAEVNQDVNEIKAIFLRERYSRIPIYEETIDNVIGILSEREFLVALLSGPDVQIRSLLRAPVFVSLSMKIAALLPQLQMNKVHMAIVVDEYGGTAGVITLEDILEELVGEIWDEHDETINAINQLDETTFEFFADYAVDDFCDYFHVPQPDIQAHSLGGWALEELEHLPQEGDYFMYRGLKITITGIEKRRIRQITVRVQAEESG